MFVKRSAGRLASTYEVKFTILSKADHREHFYNEKKVQKECTEPSIGMPSSDGLRTRGIQLQTKKRNRSKRIGSESLCLPKTEPSVAQ